MKVVAISDTHGYHRQLDLPAGDVLIHAGDVCDRGNQSEADDFFTWLTHLDFDHKLLIWGNHDFDIARERLLFPQVIPMGITVLDHVSHRIGNTVFFGVPTPADKTGEDWSAIPNDTDVLITHRPPKGVLDESRMRGSQGSRRLARRVAQVQPAIHIFGHIHHSYGHETIGATQFFNVSLFRSSRKRLVNQPITLTL